MKEIILASSNKGKIAEIEAILKSFKCIPQSSLGIQDAAETGLTFIENALIKARHASQLSNKPALADDSGLVVAALNGEPGIYSARYAARMASEVDNVTCLLNNMKNLASEFRQAYLYCAIVLVQHAHDPAPLIACGKLIGTITDEPKGANGFGYDAVFYLPAYQATLAELATDIKNAISHRAQALKLLQQQLIFLNQS